MLHQDNYFAVSVKLNFCWRHTHWHIQSVTDTENEFTACQTPRKKFQSIGISPVSLHGFMKILEKQSFRSIQCTSWLFENSEPNSYDKNDMKEKVDDLAWLHKAMQEKLKTESYSEQIQIFTLVPDKWSRMYCSEYFNIFEYLVWTSHEIKK